MTFVRYMSEHDTESRLRVQQAAALLQGKKKFCISRAGKYDEHGAQQELEALISQHGMVTFSWTFCPFARGQGAAGGAGSRLQSFSFRELNELPQGPALRAERIKVCLCTQVVPCAINGSSLTSFSWRLQLQTTDCTSDECFHQW